MYIAIHIYIYIHIWLTIFANYNLLTQTPNAFLLLKQYIRSASWKNNREVSEPKTTTPVSTAELLLPQHNLQRSLVQPKHHRHQQLLKHTAGTPPQGGTKDRPENWQISWENSPHLEGHQLASRLWRKALVFSCAQACASKAGNTFSILNAWVFWRNMAMASFFSFQDLLGKKNRKDSLWVRLRSPNFSESRSLWRLNYVSREGDSQRHGTAEFHFIPHQCLISLFYFLSPKPSSRAIKNMHHTSMTWCQ